MKRLFFNLLIGLACAVFVELVTFRGWERCPQPGTLFCVAWVPINMMIVGFAPRRRRTTF